jgi:putative ABC transport system permease protein
MKLIDILTTASSNMFRSKLRTSLTVIAIFIGAFTLTLTNGLGAGISSYIDKQLGNLGAKDVLFIQAVDANANAATDAPKPYDPSKRTASVLAQGNRTVTLLTATDLAKIRATAGINSAQPFQSATVDYIAGPSLDKFVASVSEYLTGENYGLDAGHIPSNNAAGLQLLIPSTYLTSLGYNNAGEAIDKPIKLAVTNGLGVQSIVTATIVGVQQKSLLGGGSIPVNSALMSRLIAIQNTGLPASATSSFQVATARFDATMPDSGVTDLKNRLKAEGYSAVTVQDQIGTFKTVIAGIVSVLNGFAVIALLAASFGIINTLLMSVQERTKEIGLMKAMGMGAGRIFLLFSSEAVMLGFWGSLIGSALAIVVGQIINRIVLNTFLKDLVGLQLLTFSVSSVATIVGIVMTIAFVAGTLPAIRAARQSPIDSLRYE